MKTTAHIRPFAWRAVRAAAALVVVGAVACEDPFKPTAEFSTVETTFEIWALTGSPTAFPSVLLVPQRLVVRPDAAGSFDLGFDIDPSGRLLVLPVTKVVQALAGPRQIGIIRATDAYADITAAPTRGWVLDSTFTFDVGESFIVRVQTLFCSGTFFSEVYAKYQVDSIFPTERRIKLTGRVNPNCGFRSFATGVPTF
ncbi:MAG: hypothetical protein WD771_11060 [Gemmatimonadaceae bacterium]